MSEWIDTARERRKLDGWSLIAAASGLTTEEVRALLDSHAALCDEVDRLREALRDRDERTEMVLEDVLADHWPMLGEGDASGHVVCTCGWSAEVLPHNAHVVASGHIVVQFVRARAALGESMGKART